MVFNGHFVFDMSYVSSDYSPFSGRNVLTFLLLVFPPTVPLLSVDDRQLSLKGVCECVSV